MGVRIKHIQIGVVAITVLLILLAVFYIGTRSNSNTLDNITGDSLTNCSVKISWLEHSQTGIQVNITNTGDSIINITRYCTIINPERNYDFTFEVTSPDNLTYSDTCSRWIGNSSFLRYDNYSLHANEQLNFTTSKLAMFRGIFPEELAHDGKYYVRLIFEHQFISNTIEYIKPDPYWNEPAPVWVGPVSTEWHDVNSDISLKNVIAEEMNVNLDTLHIYFYHDIQNNQTCDKFVGAVAEDNSSIVCYFDSIKNKITYIESYFKASNVSESMAFYLVATGGTNNGYYAGDFLVPSDCTANGSMYRFLYYDGWCMEKSYGLISVNVTAQTLCYGGHVK